MAEPHPKANGDCGKLMILLSMIVGLSTVVFGLIYQQYGIAFFMSHSAKSNHFDTQEVDSFLRNHTMLFVGGPHRGGTTILWQKLREHPNISGFGDKVGADLSEGIFMQTVYPKFGLLQEISATNMDPGTAASGNTKGLGKYMFNPGSHLTERSYLVSPESRVDLFNEWSYFWELHDPAKKVLLEKSPPNMRTSRFLQALFDVEGADVRFVFITRHPIANAMAHWKWAACKSQTVFELVLHWVVGHEDLEDDLPLLKNQKFIMFEDFVVAPRETMAGLHEWLGFDPEFYGPLEVYPDTNEKYKKQYCDNLRNSPGALDAHKELVDKLGSRVKVFGYDLDEYNCLNKTLAPENRTKTMLHSVA